MVYMKASSKEDIMTKKFAAVGRTLMLVAGFLAAPAVANADTLQVRVPFEFVAGKTLLPAGEYQVAVESDSSVIKLVRDNGTVVFLAGLPALPGGAQANEIQFRKVGSAYVLSKVCWTGWEMTAGYSGQGLSRAARAAVGGDNTVTASANTNIVWAQREPRR
jgi:hypothetical protein